MPAVKRVGEERLIKEMLDWRSSMIRWFPNCIKKLMIGQTMIILRDTYVGLTNIHSVVIVE